MCLFKLDLLLYSFLHFLQKYPPETNSTNVFFFSKLHQVYKIKLVIFVNFIVFFFFFKKCFIFLFQSLQKRINNHKHKTKKKYLAAMFAAKKRVVVTFGISSRTVRRILHPYNFTFTYTLYKLMVVQKT